MMSRNGFLSIALIGVIATVVTIIMIVVPIVTTKLHIQRYLQVEYKYNNAEMAMLGLVSYADIRHDLGLYVAGMSSNNQAAGSAFVRDALGTKVAAVLDKLVPEGGCYALYYDTQPYGTNEDSWTLITKREKEAGGEACDPANLLSTARTFLPLPQGDAQVMLVLKTL